jgi:glycerol-3-phosphate responsive antiterminator
MWHLQETNIKFYFLIAIKYLEINQVQKIQRKNKKKFEFVVFLVHGTQRRWLLVQGMRMPW